MTKSSTDYQCINKLNNNILFLFVQIVQKYIEQCSGKLVVRYTVDVDVGSIQVDMI